MSGSAVKDVLHVAGAEMARGYLAGMVTGAVVGGAGLALVSLMGEPANSPEPVSAADVVSTEPVPTPVEPDAAVQEEQVQSGLGEDVAEGVTQEETESQTTDTSAPAEVSPVDEETDDVSEETNAVDPDVAAAVEEAISAVSADKTEAPVSDPTENASEASSVEEAAAEVEAPVVPAEAPEIVVPEVADSAVDVTVPGADLTGETPDIPRVAMPELAQPELPEVTSPEVPEVADETPSETGQIGQEVGTGFGNPVGRLTTRTEGAEVSAAGNETVLPGTPATAGFGTTADAAETPDGALQVNAVDFEVPAGKSMMSVILLHDGGDESSALLASLAAVPFHLNIAVNGAHPAAGSDAAEIRHAGHEVLLQLALPARATPTDVETGFLSVQNMVPDAVAVLDSSAGQIASNRAVASQLSEALLESGHGLVLFNAGLNTAGQLASRAGVPNARVFRNLSAGGENAHRIRRMLQRAEFKARQDGSVVLVGMLNDETLRTLQEWALDDRGENTVLAPVSAVLLQE